MKLSKEASMKQRVLSGFLMVLIGCRLHFSHGPGQRQREGAFGRHRGQSQ
jgi:hypothetical protein